MKEPKLSAGCRVVDLDRKCRTCGGTGHGVWVDRWSFGVTAHGTDDASAVDAAILALSSRLSSRAREAVDEARRATEVAEWWQRVVCEGNARALSAERVTDLVCPRDCGPTEGR